MGPTGSGKTQLSLLLAKCLKAEIISADSMQVYRGMDIGTAKPSRSERRRVRHHLLDIVSPRFHFSVAEHRRRALGALKKCRAPVALVVGGSGLYVQSLWKGISDLPGASARLRKQLEKESDEFGSHFLHAKLKKIDPLRADSIHPNDGRRIIRALEIALVSGQKPSEGRRRVKGLEELGYSIRIFGIHRDRSELYERINERVKAMFRQGWVNEVKRLKRIGFSKTAGQALGYREILQRLCETATSGPFGPKARREGGRNNLKNSSHELIRIIQTRTRQFGKRQLTWFRREKGIEWIPWHRGESARNVCDKIMSAYGKR